MAILIRQYTMYTIFENLKFANDIVMVDVWAAILLLCGLLLVIVFIFAF